MSRTPGSPDGNGIVVRKAAANDAAALQRIAKTAAIDAWTVDQYRKEVGSENAVAFVCVENDEIVGFILGGTIPGTDFDREGEVYNIAVNDDARRRGIGRMLLRRAFAAWGSRGCGCVWLEVRASNLAAVQFYENNGFNRFSIRRNFYSDPAEDALIMRLQLKDAGAD